MLKEDGGERCSVTLGEGERAAPLEPSKFAETEVAEGDVLAVSDGVDVTEPYVEAAEPIAPGLQMEAGGRSSTSSSGAVPANRASGRASSPARWWTRASSRSPRTSSSAPRTPNPAGRRST